MVGIFDTAAGNYSMGADTLNAATAPVQAGTGLMGMLANPMALNMTMNQLMSPYISNVIDTSLNRLETRKAIDLNSLKSQAAGASAFGGVRDRLLRNDLLDKYGRSEDELTARLLQQGFDTSLQGGLSDLQRRGALASGLVGAGATTAGIGAQQIGGAAQGVNIGETLNQGQRAAGTAQQALVQRLLSLAGSQTDQYLSYPQRSVANIMSGLTGNPLNAAGTRSTTEQYNPGLFDYLSFGAGILGGGK